MTSHSFERRQTPRARCLFGGFAAFNQGKATIDCQVRNVSTDGALLSFVSGALVPERFELQIAQLGAPVQAKVLWRRENRCGVAFGSMAAVETRSPLDLAGRLAAYQPPTERLRARSA